MKVLVGIPCLLTGGTEIQTLSLIEALITAGHDVSVVCYFEHTDLMIKRYRETGAKVNLLSTDGTRPAGMVATAKFLWKGLRQVIRHEHPDVVHIQYMAPGALPIIILRTLGVKHIVATTHTNGDIYSSSGQKVIRLLTNHLLTAFQCITEIAERSYFGSSQIFNPDGSLQRHFTIYNNIPSHILIRKSPRKLLLDDEPITVGVVSRLEKIKGMDLVIPAFAKVAAKSKRLRLLIVGAGSQNELMKRQAQQAGIDNRVEFVGRKDQSELQDYYDRIDVLLMPSRSEGFGLTALEGMARGCVPVVSRVGGLPEIVIPDCGILHSPDDIDDLAIKVLSLVSDLTTLNRLSSAAIARAANFSKDSYNQSIKQLYEKIATL